MAFSTEWETIYQDNEQISIWPWSNCVSLCHRYGNIRAGMRVLELGCGAGANIPFFVQQKVDYYALDGSETTVGRIKKKFAKANVHVEKVDFSHDFHWKQKFDLIIDRAAMTHNSTSDIEHIIADIHASLASGGRFIGMDWFSTRYEAFQNGIADEIDAYTRIFKEGYFRGLGKVHFSDAEHLHKLFKGFKFLYLDEKVHFVRLPEKTTRAAWDFVVEAE